MPFVSCMLTRPASEAQCDTLKVAITGAMDGIAGKGEQYLMVAVQPDVTLFFQGDIVNASAYLDVRYVGQFPRNVKERLAESLSDAVADIMSVAKNRVYVSFSAVAADDWAHNGSLLG